MNRFNVIMTLLRPIAALLFIAGNIAALADLAPPDWRQKQSDKI